MMVQLKKTTLQCDCKGSLYFVSFVGSGGIIFFLRLSCDLHLRLSYGCRLRCRSSCCGCLRCSCCLSCGCCLSLNCCGSCSTSCSCCNCRYCQTSCFCCSCCLMSFCCSCRLTSCFCCSLRPSTRVGWMTNLAGGHIPNLSVTGGCCWAKCRFGGFRFGCLCWPSCCSGGLPLWLGGCRCLPWGGC